MPLPAEPAELLEPPVDDVPAVEELPPAPALAVVPPAAAPPWPPKPAEPLTLAEPLVLEEPPASPSFTGSLVSLAQPMTAATSHQTERAREDAKKRQ